MQEKTPKKRETNNPKDPNPKTLKETQQSSYAAFEHYSAFPPVHFHLCVVWSFFNCIYIFRHITLC